MGKKISMLFAGFLILSFLGGLSIAQEAGAGKECKDYKEYVIRVTGTGKTSVEPDSFSLIFSVESESISLSRATKDNAEKIADIIKEIKKLNIPNLEFSTSTFDFVGDKDYSFILPGKKYKIKNKVITKAEKIPYDKLSVYAADVADIAIQNGATEVRNLSFYLENRKLAENKVLKAALDDAKDKASLIAAELGVALKEPFNVLRFWVNEPPKSADLPRYEYDKFALMRSYVTAESQVIAGRETLNAQIELEYKFK